MTEPKPKGEIEPFPLLTPEQQKNLKDTLQMFNITPNDTPQQMFEKLFNPAEPLQMTILPRKPDVTHVLCLGAVDQMTRPAFYTTDENGEEKLITKIPSLPRFLYDKTILGNRSLKGAFPAIFKEIFLNNPANEMNIAPMPVPSALPPDPKRSLRDKLTGANKA